ncbi:MAG: electron transfer flavoprotein subunit beta/FixA family protein [Longimicrobiales bacterium]
MNVIVCIKRVPDTEARIRVDGSGAAIDKTGIKYDMSPYDAFAVEAALRLKETTGEGDVTLLTLGDSSSQETLRKGLAMGADRAVLLTGDVSLDGLATAKTLSAELEGMDADLFLFGIKAADDDQQQVGPMVAALTGRPCVSGVSSFEVAGGTATCNREVEGGSEVVEVDLPAVLCMTKGPNEPRLAALKGIMAAKKKPLEEKPAAEIASRVRLTGLSEPPARAAGRIVGEGADAVPELVRLLREEANAV